MYMTTNIILLILGRQQVKVEEVEQIEEQPIKIEENEEVSRRPGGLLKRIHAQRPVFKRPVLKVRRPSTSSTTAKPLTTEDKGAFLVCSEGRCFDPSTQVSTNFQGFRSITSIDEI